MDTKGTKLEPACVKEVGRKAAVLSKKLGRNFSRNEYIKRVNMASKMYHLCNNFYQARQRNVQVSAKQFTTNTSTSCIV